MTNSNPIKTTYQPYQFNRIVTFGDTSSYKNAAGVRVPKFNPQFNLHFYQVKKTLTQQYLALKSEYQDTINLVVRHDSRIADMTECQLDGNAKTTYSIIDYSPDNSTYLAYDYVTIKDTKKVGGS